MPSVETLRTAVSELETRRDHLQSAVREAKRELAALRGEEVAPDDGEASAPEEPASFEARGSASLGNAIAVALCVVFAIVAAVQWKPVGASIPIGVGALILILGHLRPPYVRACRRGLEVQAVGAWRSELFSWSEVSDVAVADRQGYNQIKVKQRGDWKTLQVGRLSDVDAERLREQAAAWIAHTGEG